MVESFHHLRYQRLRPVGGGDRLRHVVQRRGLEKGTLRLSPLLVQSTRQLRQVLHDDDNERRRHDDRGDVFVDPRAVQPPACGRQHGEVGSEEADEQHDGTPPAQEERRHEQRSKTVVIVGAAPAAAEVGDDQRDRDSQQSERYKVVAGAETSAERLPHRRPQEGHVQRGRQDLGESNRQKHGLMLAVHLR